jgi:hypothetical protein
MLAYAYHQEMNLTNIDYDEIRSKLKVLQGSELPYAAPQAYEIHPPLTEHEVIQFEREHQVTLPSEYRGFLIHVGNGGAGPHGVFRLGEMDDGWGHKLWQENDGFVGILSKPFSHTNRWNDLKGQPEYDESQAVEKGYEDRYIELLDKFDEKYWSGDQVHGAVPICHRGCALRNWLVITGPEAGHVWCDDRADCNGLYPFQENGLDRVRFIEWYNHWLEKMLARLRRKDAW